MARRNNTAKTFGDLAEQYSVEPGSQKLRGEVPPIKKYGGQPRLEQEAFALRPGELSGIIQIGDTFIILRCEEYTTPEHVEFAAVRGELYQRPVGEEDAPRDEGAVREAAGRRHHRQLSWPTPATRRTSAGADVLRIRPVSGG